MLDRQCLLTSKFAHHGAKSAKSAKMLLSEPPVFGDGSSVAASVFNIQFVRFISVLIAPNRANRERSMSLYYL